MTDRLGATPAEWAHWDLILGLTDRLLPSVSNPRAKISGSSTMKALGKTPSWYNHNREVVGIAKWTQRKAPSGAMLDRWQAEPDYGICLRTGKPEAIGATSNLVAVDLDSEKPDQVDQGLAIADKHLGELPVRVRDGSERVLLLVRVEGDPIYKRVVHLAGGERFEILGTGQQCLVAGTHPKGARYEWEGGLPEQIPVVSAEQFEAFFAELQETMGVEPASVSGERRRGERLDLDDDRMVWLEENWTCHGYGSDGQVHITCPFEDGHTSGEAGDTSTSYFPAGTGGYERGHYVCLHASCAGRTDSDFDEATGYSLEDLQDLPAPIDEKTGLPEVRPPAFERDKAGQIEARLNNILAALRAPEWLGLRVAVDEFLGELMLDWGSGWRFLQDEDRTAIRSHLEALGFKKLNKDDVREAVRLVGRENAFDSAKQWISGLVWDGVPRVERLLADYFGAADTAYAAAVSRYWMTGHAARILDPGHQCDMVPILVSPEGRYKSTALAALVPRPEMFIEVDLEHKDDDLARRMRGAMLGEIAELRGLQGRSAEANKAWVTRRFENWVPKYVESAVRHYRRLIFVGTTNEPEFLNGTTGERRWLPIEVGGADRDAIERDRDQIWAEAREMYLETGEVWWRDAYELGPAERVAFQLHDIWEAPVERWVAQQEEMQNTGVEGELVEGEQPLEFTIEEVVFGALGLSAEKCGLREMHRIGRVLRSCGFERIRTRRKSQNVYLWRRAAPLAPLSSLSLGELKNA